MRLKTFLLVKCGVLILGIIAFVVQSCNRVESQQILFDPSENLFVETVKSQTVSLDSLLPSNVMWSVNNDSSLLVLDSAEIIGSVDKVQITSDKVFVLDKTKSRGLFCYDRTGKLIWSYKVVGHDRSQLTEYSDFHVSDSRAYLLDARMLKTVELDLDGHFITERSLKKFKDFYPDAIFREPSGNIILYNADMGDHNRFPFEVIVLDSTCENIVSVHIEKSTSPSVKSWANEGSPLSISFDNKSVLFSDPKKDTIYNIGTNLFNKAYVISFGKSAIPEKIRFSSGFNYAKFTTSKYAGNIERICDGKESTLFMYTNSGRPKYVLLDKKTGKARNYELLLFQIESAFQMILPVGGGYGEMACVIPPSQVAAVWSNFKRQNKNLSYEEALKKLQSQMPLLHRLVTNISMKSNPGIAILSIPEIKNLANENL